MFLIVFGLSLFEKMQLQISERLRPPNAVSELLTMSLLARNQLQQTNRRSYTIDQWPGELNPAEIVIRRLLASDL